MCDNVISMEEYKNRNKPLEFAWSFNPDSFYPISFNDLDRIFELLNMDDDNMTANIRYR